MSSAQELVLLSFVDLPETCGEQRRESVSCAVLRQKKRRDVGGRGHGAVLFFFNAKTDGSTGKHQPRGMGLSSFGQSESTKKKTVESTSSERPANHCDPRTGITRPRSGVAQSAETSLRVYACCNGN